LKCKLLDGGRRSAQGSRRTAQVIRPIKLDTEWNSSDIIANYAEPIDIRVAVQNAGAEIKVGDYRFSNTQFQELLDYVWRGGYPRWKDDIRPAYVSAMRDNIMRNRQGIFEGMNFR